MVELTYSNDDTQLLVSGSTEDKDVSTGIGASHAHSRGQRQSNGARSVGDENWRSRLRHAEYRSKVLKSFTLCGCNFSVGVVTGILGPAFLDLQLITHTNVQQASAFLTASSAGSMVGSVLSGFVYDLGNKDLVMVSNELLMGLMVLAIPFCSLYWLMVSACFLLNVFRMITALASNAEMFRTWGTQGTTFVQALHFSYTFGGMIAPLIAEPFLASRDSNSTAAVDRSNRSGRVINRTYYDLDPDFDLDTYLKVTTDATTSDGDGEPDNHDAPDATSTRIYIAFIICSILCFLISLFLVLECVCGRKTKAKKASGKPRLNGKGVENGGLAAHATAKAGGRDRQESFDGERQRQATDPGGEEQLRSREPLLAPGTLDLPVGPYIGVMAWIGFFFCLYIGNQYTANYYLATFAVLQVQWSKSQAALLSSVFWISMGSCRFFCIFLAKCLTPVKLVVLAFVVWIPSLVAFVFVSLYRVDWGVWLCSVLFAAAMSPVYASFFSWMNANLVPSTGKMNSYVGVASQTGSFISITVLGNIIESQGAIWFAYIMLGEATLTCLFFVSLLLFTRLYLQPNYRKTVTVTYSATNGGSTATTLK